MKITDEAVEAAAEAIKNGRPFRHAETARAALTAALPHMADTPCDHICMGECATDDCENCGIHHFEVGGVGSYYCGSCLKKIAALASHEPASGDASEPADDTLGANLGSAPEPAKDGPEVVERLRKWCSETINQWSDEYEPRENWERQVSGAMREWDKATTEIISDYEALQAENERLREAVDYYEIGVCAVAVPHDAERKVLHDCVTKARAILAALNTKGGKL